MTTLDIRRPSAHVAEPEPASVLTLPLRETARTAWFATSATYTTPLTGFTAGSPPPGRPQLMPFDQRNCPVAALIATVFPQLLPGLAPPQKAPPASTYPATGIRARELRKGASGNAECSGRGVCNRATGTCQCFLGFGASNNDRGPGAVEAELQEGVERDGPCLRRARTGEQAQHQQYGADGGRDQRGLVDGAGEEEAAQAERDVEDREDDSDSRHACSLAMQLLSVR